MGIAADTGYSVTSNEEPNVLPDTNEAHRDLLFAAYHLSEGIATTVIIHLWVSTIMFPTSMVCEFNEVPKILPDTNEAPQHRELTADQLSEGILKQYYAPSESFLKFSFFFC